MVAARRGLHTLVCELDGNTTIPDAFDCEATLATETPLTSNLSSVSIDPNQAMAEYLRDRLHSHALYRLLFRNRLFEYLTAATPGMRELLTMGKLWEVSQLERRFDGTEHYDLVIVDAPATGHGLGLLEAPRTFRDAAGTGPIRRQADHIHSFITDPEFTGVVCVTLAEEMPVTETLELRESLDDRLSMGIDLVLVNAVHSSRFSTQQLRRIESEQKNGPPQEVAAALWAGRFIQDRAEAQRPQLERLKQPDADNEQLALVTLPIVFSTALGLCDLEFLATKLEEQV
jgi:anion-transporting  ArsA/GET3 family ATPase